VAAAAKRLALVYTGAGSHTPVRTVVGWRRVTVTVGEGATAKEVKQRVEAIFGVKCGVLFLGGEALHDWSTISKNVDAQRSNAMVCLHLRPAQGAHVRYYSDGSTPVARGGGFAPGNSGLLVCVRSKMVRTTVQYRACAITQVTITLLSALECWQHSWTRRLRMMCACMRTASRMSGLCTAGETGDDMVLKTSPSVGSRTFRGSVPGGQSHYPHHSQGGGGQVQV
jgi:hypothetical protein